MTVRKSKANKITAIGLSVLCLILIGFGVVLFFTGMPRSRSANGIEANLPAPVIASDDNLQPNTAHYELDKQAKTGTLPGAPENELPPGDGMFGWRMADVVSIDANGRGGKIMLQNPAFNKYVIVVELCLKNDPAVLYRSHYIAPNQYLEVVDFDSAPKPGTFAATAFLNIIDPNTMKIVDILQSPFTLTVEELQA